MPFLSPNQQRQSTEGNSFLLYFFPNYLAEYEYTIWPIIEAE